MFFIYSYFQKQVAFRWLAEELLWFIKGDTNIRPLVQKGISIWNEWPFQYWLEKNGWVSDFPKYSTKWKDKMSEFVQLIINDKDFADKWGDLGPVYGKQWRKCENFFYDNTDPDGDGFRYQSIDQIQNLINDLKTNPDSRRLMVNAWNVGELDQMVLPPCHYGFQVYTRELSEGERGLLLQPYGLDPLTKEGRDRVWKENNLPTRTISLMWNQRSVDTFLGLPFNIASYALLLEILAKEVNMVPDELIGNLGDVHLYSNHLEQAKEQITRWPMKLPTLNINDEFWNTDIPFLESLKHDNFLKCLLEEDIQLCNYESHPTIKAPLSN